MTNNGDVYFDDPELTNANQVLHDADGPNDRAWAYLRLGIISEERENWDQAISCYSKALAERSDVAHFCYFGNNNLGYSLIQLGRFDAAEEYCLAAIKLEPDRHNAYKNLGLVRQGQKDWLQAAHCFTEAYGLCPEDTRAWYLLIAVLDVQPELLENSLYLRERIASLNLETASHENLPN